VNLVVILLELETLEALETIEALVLGTIKENEDGVDDT
jgi:hypothetical protein